MEREVIIIGAGLSGLTAARVLKEAGLDVLVLDKGRSVGGRLATRRVGDGVADHGAQFFTARGERFWKQVEAWIDAGLVRVWGYGWSDGSLKRTRNDGHSRFVVNGGMNALAQYLARDLDVRVDVQVTSVQYTGVSWTLTDSQENIYNARYLVMTPPVPQSLAILNRQYVPLMPDDLAQLKRIEYAPCLCGIFRIAGDVALPEPGAIQNFNEPIYWLADNKAKGISEETIVTVHAEARYSRKHYDAPEEEVLAFMRTYVERYMREGASIVETQLKKWRYSTPLTTYPQDCFVAEGLPLVFAGDAFGGRGRVEGAYLSGLCAGQTLVATIKG